jgi:hypothetical protein
MDEFDLSPEMAVEPLSIAPPQKKPAQPQGGGLRDLGPIATLIPIALARGGRMGVAGLLQGYQQAQAQKQQQARLGQQDQRQASIDEQNRQRTDATVSESQQRQRLAYMKAYQDALANVTTPEELSSVQSAYGQMGAPLGIEQGAIGQLAATVTPNKLTQRRVEKVVKGMNADTLQALMESQASLQDGDRLIPFAEWSQYVAHGVGADGKPIVKAPVVAKPDVPNTPEERMAAALRSGDMAAVKLEEDALRRVGEARRAPDDPVLSEMRALRLEQAKAGQGAGPSLPPTIQRRVDAKAKGFDAQPAVKRTATMAEAVAFADSLDPNTKNPADDQAIIYAFAKAMDPDSVVREGEYATVQKYAQSWAEWFGFNAARVFSNTQFLTPQARANMKATIRKRYLAGKAQYDNLRKSYAAQINNITGQQDGEAHLTDYAGAFPSEPAKPAGGTTGAGGATYEEYLRRKGQR